MQRWIVVIGSGDKLSVEGKFEVGPTNVLYIKNGNETLQAFAPGAWMTIFKAPAVERIDASVLAGMGQQTKRN